MSEAILASQAHDVLVLAPGSYVEDFPDITHSLTIRCDDGMASLTRATPLTVDGRAILNVPGNLGVHLTVVGLEIFGAKRPGPDTNGAAILHEIGNGDLTIERCYIHGNENGILVGNTNAFSPSTGTNVIIRDSEFSANGAPPGSTYAAGGKCHNIYINAVTSVLIENSYIHSVFSQGHQIKSRAATNIIINNPAGPCRGAGLRRLRQCHRHRQYAVQPYHRRRWRRHPQWLDRRGHADRRCRR